MARFLTLAFLPLLTFSALGRQSAKSSADLAPSQIFSRARPAVVVIVADDKSSQREALGSGFLVSRDRIATNHHVVEGMKEAYVVFSDGMVKRVSGVVADSIQQDLIILTTETGNRPSLAFGDELSLHQGDAVYALGAPKGLQLSFTNGIVSSFRKSEGQFLIQTTAPIAPGSSGGPLFDRAGRVVGVTTSMLSDAPGIYFSVGIGDLRRLLRTPQGVALPFEEWAKRQDGESRTKSASGISSSQSQHGQPSLQETISWMSNFLEAHGQEWSGGEPSRSNVMGLSPVYRELLALRAEDLHEDLSGKEACVIFVRHNSATATRLHDDLKVPVKTWTETMFLGDIDPKSIKVVASSHVYFETSNNLHNIIETVPVGEKFPEYDLDRGWILLDSAENAQRFANAIVHAVVLCGGSTTPF
jgi:Trypsin-like peptidase domain